MQELAGGGRKAEQGLSAGINQPDEGRGGSGSVWRRMLLPHNLSSNQMVRGRS